MLHLFPAPASGRLALLLILAWLGADSGRPAPTAVRRSYRPRPAARRLLYRLGALYIRLFGLGRGVHLSAGSDSEFIIQHSNRCTCSC